MIIINRPSGFLGPFNSYSAKSTYSRQFTPVFLSQVTGMITE